MRCVKIKISIDLDGTICTIKKEGESYSDVMPLPGAIERIKEWKEEGHYIIINTARHFKTCNGNIGLILKRVGKITLDWLDKHDIPYDEIHFGRPNSEVYIDDRSIRFEGWDKISLNDLEAKRKER